MVLTAAAIFLLAMLGGAGLASRKAERMAPPLGRFVEVEGERLHVVEMGAEHRGEGPSVLLIHGASINLRDMLIALGEPLAARRHVVMVDRPGRGYSTRPENGHELDRQARLIHGAAQAAGLEAPIVVGQSLGGAIALAYALQHQREMAGLVLLAPVSHEWPGGVAWYNSAATTPVIGPLFRWFIIPAYGQLVGRSAVEGSFSPDEAPDNYYARSGLPLLFRPADFKANAEDLANLKAEIISMQDRYAELSLPVVILAGAADTTVSPKIHAEALARDIAGASLEILADTGHALHHAESERITAVIDELAAGRVGARSSNQD